MASVGATSSASGLSVDYLNLLVTQLKNQNPLEPMDNDQMTAQLTSLSSLEQLEGINTKLDQLGTLNTNFSSVLSDSQLTYARSLVGKQVCYLDSAGDIQMEYVNQIETAADGSYRLRCGDELIKPDQITSVGTEDAVQIPNNIEYANTLLDRTVYWVDSSSGTATVKSGIAKAVTENNGTIYVRADDTVIALDDIAAVAD